MRGAAHIPGFFEHPEFETRHNSLKGIGGGSSACAVLEDTAAATQVTAAAAKTRERRFIDQTPFIERRGRQSAPREGNGYCVGRLMPKITVSVRKPRSPRETKKSTATSPVAELSMYTETSDSPFAGSVVGRPRIVKHPQPDL